MFNFLNHNHQVARNTAPFTGISFAAHGKLHAFSDTCREIDGNDFFTVHYSGTMAGFALGSNNLSFSITLRTGGSGLHLPEDGIRYPAYLPLPATGRACLKRRAILSSAAAACAAGNQLIYFNFFLNSVRNFFQCQLYFNTKIAAAVHITSAASTR